MAERNYIDVLVRMIDAAKFQRDAQRSKAAVRGIGDETERTGKKAGGAMAQLAKFAGVQYAAHRAAGGIMETVAAASNLNEQASKVGVIFGPAADGIVAFADTAAAKLGQSREEALGAIGTFGNLFRSLGVGQDEAAGMSTRLDTLASDLASFNNTNPADALTALRAGLVGEVEPLRRYGITLQDVTLRQEAMALGLTNTTTKVLTPHQRMMAAYSLILKQSGLAQGDFTRTSGQLANQQRILAAEFQNLKEDLGASLLPVMRGAVGVLGDLAVAFAPLGRHSTVLRILVLTLALAWATYTVATIAATLASLELSLAMSLGIGAAIIGTAVLLVLLAEHWDTVTAAMGRVWDWVQRHWRLLALILGGPLVLGALELIVRNFDRIRDAAGYVVARVRHDIALLVRFVEWAAGKIREAWESVSGPISSVVSTVGHYTGVSAVAGYVSGLAEGGTVTAAGTVLVGEHGPELLRLPEAARVEPLPQPREHGSGGGSGGPSSITIPLVVDGRELARATWKATADARARA